MCESGGRRHADEMTFLFFSVVRDRGIIMFIGSFHVLSVMWFTVSLYISSNIFIALLGLVLCIVLLYDVVCGYECFGRVYCLSVKTQGEDAENAVGLCRLVIRMMVGSVNSRGISNDRVMIA